MNSSGRSPNLLRNSYLAIEPVGSDFFSENWRFGFEAEVVLGTLDDPRFEDAYYDPMDVASHAYCQAVAKELKNRTGHSWTAPQKETSKTGFYVKPEYDIDPINFEEDGLVAGVELITPPLRIEEAENLRFDLADAIEDLGGGINFERNDLTDLLGWHINIDAGEDRELDCAHFSVATDEVSMLRSSNRYGLPYTSTQRHGFGVALLRELGTRNSVVETGVNLRNFLNHHVGVGKRYAANFEREKYLELRHFGIADFLGDRTLVDLLSFPISSFQMDHGSFSKQGQHLIDVFKLLSDWLSQHGDRIEFNIEKSPLDSTYHGELSFDQKPAGHLSWSGTATFNLSGFQSYEFVSSIHGRQFNELPEAFALMALDLAEMQIAGSAPEIGNKEVAGAVLDLANSLQKSGLHTRPNIISASHWIP